MFKFHQGIVISLLSVSWLLGGSYLPSSWKESVETVGVGEGKVLGGMEGQKNNHSAIFKELENTQIIYLGETHDQLADHQAQLQIIQTLYQKNRKIAIALEMFQRPVQGVIDQYLAGDLTEGELIKQTDYEKRWGFPWEYYAPILRFAQQQKLSVLALNVPTEITRKVARQGLKSLSSEELMAIPPLSEIDLTNGEYRQFLQSIFEQHQTQGVGHSEGFERFFQAQVLWDETMAQTLADFVKTHPDYQVIVLAGKGHIIYGYGIPHRVQRRLKDLRLKQFRILQRSLLFVNPNESSFPTPKMADLFWYH